MRRTIAAKRAGKTGPIPKNTKELDESQKKEVRISEFTVSSSLLTTTVLVVVDYYLLSSTWKFIYYS